MLFIDTQSFNQDQNKMYPIDLEWKALTSATGFLSLTINVCEADMKVLMTRPFIW